MAKCAIGESHSITVSNEGIAYSFGYNGYGALGYESTVSKIVAIPNLPKIEMVSCGGYFTVCVDCEGFMWTFGDNTYGQLGTGNTMTYKSPQKINDIPPVRSISCGGYHTLLITNDDDILWSMGRNDTGQLCLKHSDPKSSPCQTSFSNIARICAGGYHSLFQTNDLEIFGCGDNQYCQLGFRPMQNSFDVHHLEMQEQDIIQICCGYYNSLFLNSDGDVFSAGSKSHGTRGLGDLSKDNFTKILNIPPMQQISCCGYFCYLLDFNGNVWSFGRNVNGQLGLGDTTNRNVPTKINSMKNIKQIISNSCGNHFFLKDHDNKIFTAGDNTYGQLGHYNKALSTSTTHIELPNGEQIWGDHLITSRAKSARK